MSPVYFLKKQDMGGLEQAGQTIFKLCAGLFGRQDKVAIKVHFGERQSNTYLSPVFVKAIFEQLKDKVQEAALVDCNVLYKGARALGSTHKAQAKANGFGFAPIVILDGEKGEKEMQVPIENSKHFQQVKIGSLLGDFNALLVISHFTGHSLTGFGGAIKNTGMGLGSKAGKLEMHQAFELQIDEKFCNACATCQRECPADAISIEKSAAEKAVAQIDCQKCMGCGRCIAVCPQGAIGIPWGAVASKQAQERITEYALGALKNKKSYFINVLLNITQRCDCVREHQTPIMDDIGILASDDIIAIEQASLDLAGSQHFESPGIDPTVQIKHGQSLGLGSKEYELIEL